MAEKTPEQIALERINGTSLPHSSSTILDLANLNLTTLPSQILKLKHIRVLYLSDNKLTTLPEDIGLLTNLKELDLRHNLLHYLPKGIINLTKLTNLDLRGNNLEVFPQEIIELIDLKVLYLRNNSIKMLPRETEKLQNLHRLDLRGNPLPIPPEILEKTNEPKNILNYYFSIVDVGPAIPAEHRDKIFTALKRFSSKPLNEIKLLCVGQGSVGKTSLVQQILHGTFDQSQTKTEGISINQWQVEESREAGVRFRVKPYSQVTIEKPFKVHIDFKIKLNIWDFGGQEIMHATHQFFLTKRSLYLLVLDARLTQEENRVEYWLKIIQSFGGESPVLIVGNKTDQHPLDIDRTGLQKKYPNIVGILETSAATGAGIEALKATIAKQVDTLPHVRDLLPTTWFTVKSKLEELGRDKNFITQDEYLSLCGANDVTDKTSQHTLIGFLHDLGVVLHFQDDPRLEQLGILNPQWVTNGVYKILNSHELFQNRGTLTLSMLNKILNLPEYPSNKRLFIVDMMKKFELCYDIEPDKSFLIPDLLSKDEPFTGEWDGALAFQIHYNVLPSSIISRFIVRMNAFIYKTIWRSGVVLRSGGNTALVKADTEDKNMYIRVSGDGNTRRDFLSMIRGELEAIHKTIAKIEAAEKVPLPNYPNADPVDYKLLLQLEQKGIATHHVQADNQLIEINVRTLLNGIEPEKIRAEKIAGLYIGGDVRDSTITIGDDNTITVTKNVFKSVYRSIEKSSRDETEKADLVAEINEIEDEVAKGEQANETFLSRRLRNLKKIAPDIAEVAFCLRWQVLAQRSVLLSRM